MKTIVTCIITMICHTLTGTICLANEAEMSNANRTGSFTGLIWRDANDNGIMERSEETVPYAVVKIESADCADDNNHDDDNEVSDEEAALQAVVIIESTACDNSYRVQSDANGYFIAKELPHGEYRIWNENQNQIGTAVQVVIGEVNAAQVVEIAFAEDENRKCAPLSHRVLLPLIMR